MIRAVTIDWYYHRTACAMCRRVQAFIESRRVAVKETVLADERRLEPAEVLALARRASQVWATRGKKVVHFDMETAPPSESELLRVMLAPSGNLRAPTVLVERCLLVGFDRATFRRVFDHQVGPSSPS